MPLRPDEIAWLIRAARNQRSGGTLNGVASQAQCCSSPARLGALNIARSAALKSLGCHPTTRVLFWLRPTFRYVSSPWAIAMAVGCYPQHTGSSLWAALPTTMEHACGLTVARAHSLDPGHACIRPGVRSRSDGYPGARDCNAGRRGAQSRPRVPSGVKEDHYHERATDPTPALPQPADGSEWKTFISNKARAAWPMVCSGRGIPFSWPLCSWLWSYRATRGAHRRSRRTIPAQYLAYGIILAAIPAAALILGLTLLRRSPDRLFALGYGVEGPLMLILAFRFFVVRDATPAVTLLLSVGVLGMATLVWELLDRGIDTRRPWLAYVRAIG